MIQPRAHSASMHASSTPRALEFDAEFDAAFSNAALHWMKDPDRVIAGVRRALKPGGRFVGECGGLGNVRTFCRARSRPRSPDAASMHPRSIRGISPARTNTVRGSRRSLDVAASSCSNA
jgi:SAM-dependent methyltransferase